MARAWLVLALVAAGVIPAAAEGKSAPSTSKSATSTKKSTEKKKPQKKAKSKTKSKSDKASARLKDGSMRGVRGDNMPKGFTWPPSPQMLVAEKACETRLDAAGVGWKPADRDGRMVDAITIEHMTLGGVSYVNAWGGKGPYKLDCQLAVALETIGTELYALGVREVRFGSIYRWSKVRAYGKTKNILSRHALGLAMDVVSFIDENGRAAVVKTDYPKDDALLLAIERTVNGSGRFRIVLTPKNDPVSHSDHFHIEAASDFTATP